jgi:hypothetical protein
MEEGRESVGRRVDLVKGFGDKVESGLDMVEELVDFVVEGCFEGADQLCWVVALN